MADLNQVFGISRSIPLTYYDRAGLDRKFQDALGRDQHIFIYGDSKQGKTTLRKQSLPEDQCIVVQGRSTLTLERLYAEISRQLDLNRVTLITIKEAKEKQIKGGAGFNVLGLGHADVGGSRVISEDRTMQIEPVPQDPTQLIYFVADKLSELEAHCVIEDFHYLPDSIKPQFAEDLKLLGDRGVFLIVVGIFQEQNSFGLHLRDLDGRYVEIPVHWSASELRKVLKEGERLLNIEIQDDIKNELVSDAMGNVGMLQRLAYALCWGCGIEVTQKKLAVIGGKKALTALANARNEICCTYQPRYEQVAQAAERGFREYDGTRLRVYRRIFQTFVEASDEEVRRGIPKQTIIDRIRDRDFGTARDEDRKGLAGAITTALGHLNDYQEHDRISPIMTYNERQFTLQLVDPTFLFYRKHRRQRRTK